METALKKIYLEITNVCNLSCGFCHGTARAPYFMPVAEFRALAEKARPVSRYLYLHVMGEPLLHPALDGILSVCDALDFLVVVATNGTLLPGREAALLRHPSLYKVCFSLHAFEANGMTDLPAYLAPILRFAADAADRDVKIGLRLWNGDGADMRNAEIRALAAEAFPLPYEKTRGGERLRPGVYFETGDRFGWPDPANAPDAPRFCMGLRDQAAVLCDGTVVPCCLDADGNIPLGNLHEKSLEEILRSPRALRLREGFSRGIAAEELCRRCPFARQRFG